MIKKIESEDEADRDLEGIRGINNHQKSYPFTGLHVAILYNNKNISLHPDEPCDMFLCRGEFSHVCSVSND
jgi:hypothetical protein